MAAKQFPRQNALQDAQFSNTVKKQSLSAYESLDAGLTIKTKEGDLVTLTSNTHAGLDAFMYNGKGIVETGSGSAVVTQNQREITLTSGESFSFSVVGDLSEQELTDIESIVKGIDEVIAEMAEGDMDDALDKALSMGGYDTVSMYSADITYQRSYSTHNINRFVEQMARQLETHEDRLVEKARQPIDRLFKQQMREMRQNNREETPAYTVMHEVRQQIAEMMRVFIWPAE